MADNQTDHDLLIELRGEIRHLIEAVKEMAKDFSDFKSETEKNFKEQRAETDSLKYFKSKLIGGALAISSASSLLLRYVHF